MSFGQQIEKPPEWDSLPPPCIACMGSSQFSTFLTRGDTNGGKRGFQTQHTAFTAPRMESRAIGDEVKLFSKRCICE